MPSILRYLTKTGSLYVRRGKEGFPEGSSEHLKWPLNKYLGVPPLSTESAEPDVEPCRDTALHFLCILFKAFRAVCKVSIKPFKIPTAIIRLSWRACAKVTIGPWYSQGCPAAAEQEGSGHRAAQHFCRSTHVFSKILMSKWDRLGPASPASCFSWRSFTRQKNTQCLCHLWETVPAELAEDARWSPFGFRLDEKEQACYLAWTTLF